MDLQTLLIGGLLAAIGIYFFWAAYQIPVNSRMDLVQVGATVLTGVLLYRRQFAVMHLFQGATCLATGLFLMTTESFSPGIWIFVGLSCALSVRRQMLIRVVEKLALKGTST